MNNLKWKILLSSVYAHVDREVRCSCKVLQFNTTHVYRWQYGKGGGIDRYTGMPQDFIKDSVKTKTKGLTYERIAIGVEYDP